MDHSRDSGGKPGARPAAAADERNDPLLYSADSTLAEHISARVLAVDDCPVILLVITAALEAQGYEVLSVENGELAIAAAQDHSFDVVILDVTLAGGMSGLEVGRALRRGAMTRFSKIVMHTAELEEMVATGFAGYDAFLSKPCDPKLLAETVARMVHDTSGKQSVASIASSVEIFP